MSWDTACFKKSPERREHSGLQGEYVGIPSRQTYLPKGTHLKDVVSPETYARFVTAAKRPHSTASNYMSLQPQWAANAFLSNIYRSHDFSNQSYSSNMPDLGRSAGTPVKAVDLFVGRSDERNNRNLLNAKDSEACLNSVLDRVDYTLDVLPGVIDAWQKGDIAKIVANFPDENNRCLPPDTPDSNVIMRENAGRWTQALSGLLDKPGRSIAALPLNWLLYKAASSINFALRVSQLCHPKGSKTNFSSLRTDCMQTRGLAGTTFRWHRIRQTVESPAIPFQQSAQIHHRLTQRLRPAVPHHPSRVRQATRLIPTLRRREQCQQAQFVMRHMDMTRSRQGNRPRTFRQDQQDPLECLRSRFDMRPEGMAEFTMDHATFRFTGNRRPHYPDDEVLGITQVANVICWGFRCGHD